MKRIIKTTEKFGKVLLILMISISQFSFPLEVLADELTQNIEETVQEELTENEVTTENEESTENSETTEGEDNTDTEVLPEDGETSEEETENESTTSKYTLTINGESVTEYTVKETDNKLVNINQEYNGEEGTYTFNNLTETIDFTNMLYGDYEYIYSVSNETEILESKTITIHYTGDNSEILNTTSTAKYVDGTYFIKGKKEYLTVSEVFSNFNKEELENNYSTTLVITDLEETVLTDTDNVMNDYKLVLSNGTVTETYVLKVEGDYTNDSLVTEEDASALVDKILTSETNDLNEDKPFDILDATNPVFTTENWENNLIAQDTLTNSLENKAEVSNGEEVVVKYYINGFEFDYLTGIQGKINYNKELLKLTNVEIDNLYGNFNEEGTFAYLLNNYNSNGILMTLTFQTLNPGEAEISIENIIASTGVLANLDSNSISTTITILDYGKGGDVEEPEETTPEEETQTPTEPVTIPQQTVVVPTTNRIVTPVVLSSNATIESLIIKEHNISFDKNTYEYSIKVKNKVKSLDLSIILSDSKASYTIEGNKNFKVGENVVTITVTAEDGSTKTYTIKVNREEAEEEITEEEDVEENTSSKTIIIILIVLVIIGLIYVIFKDDEEDKKESKK